MLNQSSNPSFPRFVSLAYFFWSICRLNRVSPEKKQPVIRKTAVALLFFFCTFMQIKQTTYGADSWNFHFQTSCFQLTTCCLQLCVSFKPPFNQELKLGKVIPVRPLHCHAVSNSCEGSATFSPVPNQLSLSKSRIKTSLNTESAPMQAY